MKLKINGIVDIEDEEGLVNDLREKLKAARAELIHLKVSQETENAKLKREGCAHVMRIERLEEQNEELHSKIKELTEEEDGTGTK